MADLREHANGINPKEAARLLIYRPRYSSETLYRGIHRLTERAVAHFGGHLWISYPEPALHLQPRELEPDAEVLGAFIATMDAAMDRRPWAEETTLFHLTGGFDSGTVATRAAERYPGRFPTATLLVGGPGREQQVRRRTQMRDRVKFADLDLITDAMRFPQLSPDCPWVNGQVVNPTEEPLHRPFIEMARSIAATGARTVVTGLGGDEMVALTQEEETHEGLGELTDAQILPWVGSRSRAVLEFADDGIAPPALINSMTLLSLETTAPVLLRHGLWPMHPFADPSMVELGEQLPFAWRELKQLQRRRLGALGMSKDVVHPVERESFAEVVEHALTTHAPKLFARMLAHGSPLFDEGLVDPDGLRIAVDHLAPGRIACLESSMATVVVLALSGQGVSRHHGVRCDPLVLRAWVWLDGVPGRTREHLTVCEAPDHHTRDERGTYMSDENAPWIWLRGELAGLGPIREGLLET